MTEKVYEIYTKNPETGEGGWHIVWVRTTPELIEKFPLFDQVITVNDFPMSGDRSMIVDYPVEEG